MEQTVQEQIAARRTAAEELKESFGRFTALVLTSPIEHGSEIATALLVAHLSTAVAALTAQVEVQANLISEGVDGPGAYHEYVVEEGPRIAREHTDALVAEVVSRVAGLDASRSPLSQAFGL